MKLIDETALTFDDVLLVPSFSAVLPANAEVHTTLAPGLQLNIPLMSAAMDTVTEAKMAIALAASGGIGIIHKSLDADEQAEEVRRVKRFEAGMVQNPITLQHTATLGDARRTTEQHGISGLPIVTDTGELVGMLTSRDMRYIENFDAPVTSRMTANVITAPLDCSKEYAQELLGKHRIEKLPLVDDHRRCRAMITAKDIARQEEFPNSAKDSRGRLLVGAAIGVGEREFARCEQLIEKDCDLLVIDTAHGHSAGVIEQVRRVAKLARKHDKTVMAGNVVTAAAAEALADAGANVIKVGIGPGSICTTRIVAGAGLPQLTAVMETAAYCRRRGVTVVADGGVRYSGDVAKVLAAGAHAVMIGSLLSGTDESPGEVFLFQGRSYKAYRGMGSLAAMARGSADRYFQEQVSEANKLVPEGVEGRVPYKGSVMPVLHQLVGGLRSAMGYVGAPDLPALAEHTTMRRVSGASGQESHVHNVTVTREPPNYKV